MEKHDYDICKAFKLPLSLVALWHDDDMKKILNHA